MHRREADAAQSHGAEVLRPRLPYIAWMLAVLTMTVVGCKSTPESEESVRARYGVEANLRTLGSAVTGKIRALDRGDGVTLLVSAINLPPGSFRITFNTTGNCSSPNGFSAGPAWAPPGSVKPATELVPVLTSNPDGNAEESVHVAGVHTTGENGISGHSVLVYAGDQVMQPRPGERNEVLACGVFVPAVPFQF